MEDVQLGRFTMSEVRSVVGNFPPKKLLQHPSFSVFELQEVGKSTDELLEEGNLLVPWILF